MPKIEAKEDKLEVDRYRQILDQPHKLGELLKTTFKESNTAKDALRNALKELLCNDVQARNELKGIIRSVEREKTIWFIRGFGKIVSYIMTLIIGAIFSIFVLWIAHKFGITP